MEEGEANRDVEVAPALIAVHPSNSTVVVVAGFNLRVYDLAGNRPVTLGDDPGSLYHSDSIRAIRFAPNGELFVSAGDDKHVNVWSVDSWRCIRSVRPPRSRGKSPDRSRNRFCIFATLFDFFTNAPVSYKASVR